jgi:Flp pilus assembly pilin Flp
MQSLGTELTTTFNKVGSCMKNANTTQTAC